MLTSEHEKLWREMMRKSFDPRQWFEGRDDLEDGLKAQAQTRTPEVTLMWVYKKTERNLYTVGFYDPAGNWYPDSDHESVEKAVARVHWLNGGGKE